MGFCPLTPEFTKLEMITLAAMQQILAYHANI